MNWDRVQSNWPELRASVRQRWGKLTNQHLSAMEGKAVRQEDLAHQLKDAYGINDGEAARQIAEWQGSLPETFANMGSPSPHD
jgi:uncharacterized protein YjbJ (UPF0337 family)